MQTLLRLHRWLGLLTAVFLFIAGLTGAIIAWEQELDTWLNADMLVSEGSGPMQPAAELARRLEQREPWLRVRYLPMVPSPGHALTVSVEPRIDPRSGKPYELDYDQVALDPRSGAVQGRRKWGEISLSRRNLVPFVYRLHYSLHLPEIDGIDTGIWLMGLIAVAWLVDGVIALWIAFPSRKVWRRSFAFRGRQGGHELTFDLHRSGGVWVWSLLVVLSLTAVSMNLEDSLVRPLVGLLSPLAPSPFAPPDETSRPPADAKIDRGQALAIAQAEAHPLGIREPLGDIFYLRPRNVYGVGFFQPGHEHGDGGFGNPRIVIDGDTGRVIARQLPGVGSAGDIFMQAQFPLRSGRILGVAGRVLVSCLGIVVALLSVTGVILWARKLRARVRAEARSENRLARTRMVSR